jgi:sec-independent protein translocase protein TatA
MGIGWTEIIVVLVIILLLFGAKRLPDLARSLGKSVQEFKKGLSEISSTEKPKSPEPDKTEEPSDKTQS